MLNVLLLVLLVAFALAVAVMIVRYIVMAICGVIRCIRLIKANARRRRERKRAEEIRWDAYLRAMDAYEQREEKTDDC